MTSCGPLLAAEETFRLRDGLVDHIPGHRGFGAVQRGMGHPLQLGVHQRSHAVKGEVSEALQLGAWNAEMGDGQGSAGPTYSPRVRIKPPPKKKNVVLKRIYTYLDHRIEVFNMNRGWGYIILIQSILIMCDKANAIVIVDHPIYGGIHGRDAQPRWRKELRDGGH